MVCRLSSGNEDLVRAVDLEVRTKLCESKQTRDEFRPNLLEHNF